MTKAMIRCFDAKGSLVTEFPESNHKRMSMRAAYSHKMMDKAKAEHPVIEKCLIVSPDYLCQGKVEKGSVDEFCFKNGRSWAIHNMSLYTS